MITRTNASRPAAIAKVALLALLLVAVLAPASLAAKYDKQTVYDFEAFDSVTGSFSMLERGHDGITSRVRTSGTPGHALTLWYVVFNDPTECSDGVCNLDDLFIDGDMAKGPNTDRIEAARISVLFAGDGAVVNPGGRLALDGGLRVGEVPTGSVPVAIGRLADGALIDSPVTGIEDAQTAEVHIVVQDHGQAHTDPARLEAQLTGFMTECNPDCVDVQFAVHQ